jgi:hypothetical protein
MAITINGTTGLAGVDGSAGTPAVQGADANTGIFFPAADTIAFSEGGVEAMRINSSGNVGIGTTSPTSKLTVDGAFLITGQGRSTTGWAVGADGSTFTPSGLNAIPNYGTGYITSTSFTTLAGFGGASFYTNQLERMRIDGSGNVMMGVASPLSSGKFSISFNGATRQGQVLRTTKGTTGSTYIQFENSAGSTAGYIIQNGTTTVNYVTSSDYRLKEAITPMTGALAKVAQLKPVTYKWKVDGSDGEGFIAHELAEVCPTAVTREKDAVDAEGNPQYQGIDTSFLVATLTAAIQEQQALITQLQADVAALKGTP